MNSIGFKNFRRFQNFPEIDLGDITILVGGNNAGKSTLVKAMLLMRDFLKSRIEGASKSFVFKTFNRQFSFDAEHVNVGDFYRAFCRQSQSNENTISFEMKIDKFHFSVNVCGERKPGFNPLVSSIVVEDISRDVTFTFDFDKGKMTARFGYDKKALNDDSDRKKVIARQSRLQELEHQLSKNQNLSEIADLKLQIEQLEKEIELQRKALGLNIAEEDEVIIGIEEMNSFEGNNGGKLIIPGLVHDFVDYAGTGTLGDKRSSEYKKQEGKKIFLKGKAEDIKKISEELEAVLNDQVVEYIYSHSVTQTPCYSNATSSNDYATRAIHEFYRSRISLGDEEYKIIEKGLELFEIGKSLKVIPFLGDSYRVVIFDDENPATDDEGGIDLADKGMGSIQIILLLLRLATLARKYKGLNLTVLLEEPEQNLHPALQSKLAELLHYLDKDFGIRFIVETHSEYLVRNSQVIVGRFYDSEEKAKDIPFNIYYMPQHSLPYPIGYTLTGRLTDKFEPGFFDEAGKANFYLMRKERGLE